MVLNFQYGIGDRQSIIHRAYCARLGGSYFHRVLIFTPNLSLSFVEHFARKYSIPVYFQTWQNGRACQSACRMAGDDAQCSTENFSVAGHFTEGLLKGGKVRPIIADQTLSSQLHTLLCAPARATARTPRHCRSARRAWASAAASRPWRCTTSLHCRWALACRCFRTALRLQVTFPFLFDQILGSDFSIFCTHCGFGYICSPAAVCVGGFLIAVKKCVGVLTANKTSPHHTEPTTTLVTTGPYAYSRNPACATSHQ